MNRRALFGFLSVSPLAVVGSAVAAQAAKSDAPPEGQVGGLGLVPSKLPKKPRALPSGRFITMWPEPDYSRQIEISVGADGNLWVRPKGKDWQRVVTA